MLGIVNSNHYYIYCSLIFFLYKSYIFLSFIFLNTRVKKPHLYKLGMPTGHDMVEAWGYSSVPHPAPSSVPHYGEILFSISTVFAEIHEHRKITIFFIYFDKMPNASVLIFLFLFFFIKKKYICIAYFYIFL
jgi:hypothetical protein